MSESAPVIADVPPLSEEAVERLARQRAEACFYEDLFGFGWITIGRGIIVAGGAYPMVLALCYISLTGIVELLT
ncbi:MAG TPA: hypothetical protein VHU84_09290, partial [Lacipirellulaceae bacterium]|nr:hypothetical protein [Lacipirellulaceae bacterium]